MLHAGHGPVPLAEYLSGVLLTLLAVTTVAVVARGCLRAVEAVATASEPEQDARGGAR